MCLSNKQGTLLEHLLDLVPLALLLLLEDQGVSVSEVKELLSHDPPYLTYDSPDLRIIIMILQCFIGH